jgi:two-component system CheB/CheR fusion protein
MAATNIPTLFLSTDLRINRFTPQFGEVFSVTARDHGRPIGNFTHRLDYDTLEADAHAVLTQSTPIEREVQARDGRTFILRLAPYRTSEAKVEGIVVTLVDVTELLKAETESRENAAQFRALVDASAQMVWTADPAGRHIEDSPSWRSFTGQSFDQWMSSWLEAVHPNDQQLAADGWKQAVETQSTFASEFRVFNAATQTYRWTTVRAVPLQAADGTIRGWVGMHTDVTERRQAEEALREADRRKDEFLAILGHELRNPLAAIRNSVAAHELTVTDGEDPDRSWAIMDRQSQHMTRLVNDLLDIVRLERGKLQLQPEPIDLLDCVREVAQGIQGSCRTARLTLNVELPDEPLHVQADPERMIQVLDNLLRNAVSYTGPGGEITIVARRQGKRATVCIRDTGIGMEPSEIDQLFEPYHQINPGRRSGGLGLGLTLVKRLMELHGGTVSARSDGVGNGSEFEIGLTLAATESQKSASATLQKPPRRRVLVVDDEPDVASTFASLLEALDQEVIVVNTGKAGLDAAHEHSPEIVFLDLSMPVMDGRAVARQLRENGAQDLYIVALSGFGRDKQLSRDFDDHLLKPATADTLIGLLTSFDRAP